MKARFPITLTVREQDEQPKKYPVWKEILRYCPQVPLPFQHRSFQIISTMHATSKTGNIGPGNEATISRL